MYTYCLLIRVIGSKVISPRAVGWGFIQNVSVEQLFQLRYRVVKTRSNVPSWKRVEFLNGRSGIILCQDRLTCTLSHNNGPNQN